MATKKQAPRPPNGTARWQPPSSSLDALDPAERIAHDILAERRDLLPSVGRIMTAGLGTDGTLRAISLFRDALSNPGDVHRDPRLAIADGATVADRAAATPSDE